MNRCVLKRPDTCHQQRTRISDVADDVDTLEEIKSVFYIYRQIDRQIDFKANLSSTASLHHHYRYFYSFCYYQRDDDPSKLRCDDHQHSLNPTSRLEPFCLLYCDPHFKHIKFLLIKVDVIAPDHVSKMIMTSMVRAPFSSSACSQALSHFPLKLQEQHTLTKEAV